MKRTSFIVLVALFSAASAWAAVSPTERTAFDETRGHNVTVVEKNQAFPLVGPFTVEECLNEDCTLTRG